MPNYHVNIECSGQGRTWKYPFYASGADAESVLTAAVGERENENSSNLITAFRNVHAKTTLINAISASNVNGKRKDTRRRTILAKGLSTDDPSTTPTTDDNPDQPQAAIIWQLYAAEGSSRTLTLSGVPDWFIKFDDEGLPLLQPRVEALLEIMTEAIAEASLMIRAKADDVADTITEHLNVFRFVGEAGSDNRLTRVVYEDDANLLIKGTRVDFLGLKKNNVFLLPYKGEFTVRSSGAADETDAKPYVVIETQYLGPDAGYKPKGVQIRGLSHEYHAILAQGDFVDFGTRKRGASDTPSGRDSGQSFREQPT